MRLKSFLMLGCVLMLNSSVQAQIISTIAGNDTIGYVFGFCGDEGPAIYSCLDGPTGLAIDNIGNIYIADEYNFRIRKIDTAGTITTIAGNGVYGYGGDDSAAINAEFCDLGYIALGPDGNLYIPDVCNNRIRKVDFSTGIITTVVGTGVLGFAGDDGVATGAQLWYPAGIVFDYMGNLIFCEVGSRLFKVNDFGIMNRIAGGDSVGGFGGDGGPATNALFNHPVDMTFDKKGNLYVTDEDNYVVRKIDTNNIISTFAGVGTSYGFGGNGGLATLAHFSDICGITSDGADNIFVADWDNCVVWRIDHETNIITIVAGNGVAGYSGDSGLATNAKLCSPTSVAFDKEGNLYIADWGNNRIRKVTNVGVPLGVRSPVPPCAVNSVNLYPNPTSKQITLTGVGGSEVAVMNIWGEKMMKFTATQSTLVMDVSALPGGVYFVELNNPGTGLRVVKRFLKE